TASFAAEGWLTRIEASGAIKGSQQSGKVAEEFIAATAWLELWPKVNQPKELNLKGNVRLRSRTEQTGESRTLQTSALLGNLPRAGKAKEAGRSELKRYPRARWSGPIRRHR